MESGFRCMPIVQDYDRKIFYDFSPPNIQKIIVKEIIKKKVHPLPLVH